MSSPTPPTQDTDLRPLSGLLWMLGGVLVAVAAGLADGLHLGLLTLGVWCLVTSWRMGVPG